MRKFVLPLIAVLAIGAILGVYLLVKSSTPVPAPLPTPNLIATDVSHKIIFHQIAGFEVERGPAWPDGVSTVEELEPRILNDLKSGKAFVIATVGLEGPEGLIVISLVALTGDGEGIRGWNVVTDKLLSLEGAEHTYVSVENKKVGKMSLNPVYSLLAEIDPSATEPNLSLEELDAKIKPYLEYLWKLL